MQITVIASGSTITHTMPNRWRYDKLTVESARDGALDIKLWRPPSVATYSMRQQFPAPPHPHAKYTLVWALRLPTPNLGLAVIDDLCHLLKTTHDAGHTVINTDDSVVYAYKARAGMHH